MGRTERTVGLIGVLAFGVLTLTACAGRGHDTVVGVVPVCTEIVRSTNGPATSHELTGDVCREEAFESGASLQLTVRTAKGTTYTAKVPLNTQINIGQRWPP